MDYEVSDSSGTDDDLPPSHQNRFAIGARSAGNGRSAVGGPTAFSRMHSDMETQIHLIEQEAYSSVLRAFKAQSDAITWEKESLITELRKELRVSDEEHRELLSRVNGDDIIKQIREWRKTGGLQNGMLNNSHPSREHMASPTVSASRKKHKTSQSLASLPLGAPSPVLHQPSSSSLKRCPVPGSRGKKPKPYGSTGFSGRTQGPSQGPGVQEGAEVANFDPLVGKKVWLRWPDDKSFYVAVITDYNPVKGQHFLVYDINTSEETFEWIDLKEIPSEDIRWEGDDLGMSHRGGRGGSGRGFKKSMGRGGATMGASGRGRGGVPKIQPKKDFPPSQNGSVKKMLGNIEILHTDSLVKEVERVFGASHPDPAEIEKAKKVLLEQEQALVDAIAKLEEASDGESDKGDHQFSQGQSMGSGHERGWRKRHYDEMGGEGRVLVEGSDGNKRTTVGSDRQENGG